MDLKLRQRISQIYGKTLSSENVFNIWLRKPTLSVMTLLVQGQIIYMVPNYLQIFHLANSLGIKVKCFITSSLGLAMGFKELKK